MPEKHQPSPEEMAVYMTDEQKAASDIRAEGFALGEQSVLEQARQRREKRKFVFNPEILNASVETITLRSEQMTTRFQKILKNANIFTIQDIVDKSAAELVRSRGFGRGMIDDLNVWLHKRHLKLKPTIPWKSDYE